MSMTWEEARIELQAMKNIFEEYEPGGSRCQMALKVALTALRPSAGSRWSGYGFGSHIRAWKQNAERMEALFTLP